MVFQDPASSLNRRKTVAGIIKQPMRIHGLYKGERDERVDELMDLVGLSPQHSNRYPHEFSGGQRQRVGIARALAVEPEFLVCDEPVSALDVSIQAQILNLMEDLQAEFDLTMLFIAHDLSVIRHICDRVAVMYLGEIMEVAPTDQLFENPQHPYTRSLLRAIPEPDPTLARDRQALSGQVPSPIDPPSGCSFHTRCPEATEECAEVDPPLDAVEGPTWTTWRPASTPRSSSPAAGSSGRPETRTATAPRTSTGARAPMRPAIKPLVRLGLTLVIVWFYDALLAAYLSGWSRVVVVVLLAIPTWVVVARAVFPVDDDDGELFGFRRD